MYRKFGEIRTIVFLRYASRQTDRQTNRHTDCNTSHPDRGRSNDVAAAAAAFVVGIAVGQSPGSTRLQQGCRSDADIAVQAGATSCRGRVVGARSRETTRGRVQTARRAQGARRLRGTPGHPPVMTSLGGVFVIILDRGCPIHRWRHAGKPLRHILNSDVMADVA